MISTECFHSSAVVPSLPPPQIHFLEERFLADVGGWGVKEKGVLSVRENVIFEEHTLWKIHVSGAPRAVAQITISALKRIECSHLPVFHAVRIKGG